MDFPALIQQYGYAAVFVGSVLEGETLLALAGVAAHRGYLSLQGVIAVAVAGAFAGDQLCFLAGRRFGGYLLARWPRLEPSVARADALLERRGAVLVISLRFMYGLRLAGVLAVGMSRMRWLRFAGLNLIGALLWAPLVALAGYVLGNAVERIFRHLQLAAEYGLLAAAIVAAVTVWVIHRRRKRARNLGQ